MNNQFLYVFSEDDRDALAGRGLRIFHEDSSSGVYVFFYGEEDAALCPPDFLADIEYVLTSTVSF